MDPLAVFHILSLKHLSLYTWHSDQSLIQLLAPAKRGQWYQVSSSYAQQHFSTVTFWASSWDNLADSLGLILLSKRDSNDSSGLCTPMISQDSTTVHFGSKTTIIFTKTICKEQQGGQQLESTIKLTAWIRTKLSLFSLWIASFYWISTYMHIWSKYLTF